MFDFMMATTPEICGELGLRLRARRLMQGWTQVELAERAGLSSGTVKNLEKRGQASLESFVQIVAALGLADDLGELFRLKVASIAAMEKAEQAKRQRAPRRTSR
ncbi:helix-turn-helix domain-containing protein [Duganella radicis]|uniref:Helix-turn-helix domain-containing protein n=1 Tax=Duganella radicis TaxID=551988 RepID=A0A6L6PMA8_9BURK|nr:helix-turn-helix transcriptional regulator [Duganella radicis]MTV40093.1 helix-turn-helix domain-containing protein [Duganella radicis]